MEYQGAFGSKHFDKRRDFAVAWVRRTGVSNGEREEMKNLTKGEQKV